MDATSQSTKPNLVDSGLSDSDISKMSQMEDSGLTDADMQRMSKTPGNITKSEDFMKKALGSIMPSLQAAANPNHAIGGMGPGLNFANEFKRQMFNINPQQKLAQSDYSGYVGDYAKDYFSDPNTLAMGMVGANEVVNPLIKSAREIPIGKSGLNPIKAAMNIGKKVGGWLKEPWQNEANINTYQTTGEQGIEKNVLNQIAQAQKTSAMRKSTVQKLYGDEPKANLESNTAYLNKTVTNASDAEAQQLQGELPEMFRGKSEEYGQQLNALIGDNPIPVRADKIQPALEQSLLQHGVLKADEVGNIIPARAPLNSAESKMMRMYNNFKQGLVDNPDIAVDASDLLKSQDAMKVPYGKQWTPGQQLTNTVRNNVSGALEDSIPGLSELRQSHAPYLQGKYAAVRELNPYSNEYNTGKAAGFLENQARGTLAPDDKRLVSFLEDGLGREINPTGKAAGNRLTQATTQGKAIQQRLQQELAKVDQATQDSITAIKSAGLTSKTDLENTVNQMIRKNNLQKWVRGGVGLVGEEILRNSILGKVTNWLGKKPE